MFHQEIKLKNNFLINKIDIKKKSHRKSMLINIPRFFIVGKMGNTNLTIKKNNEINQIKKSNDFSYKYSIKKSYIRKYTKEFKNFKDKIDIKGNYEKKSNNIFNNYKFYPTTIKSFAQIEKKVYDKFHYKYNKYFLLFQNKNDVNDNDNDNDKVCIYDYSQLNNIISNKKCKLKVIVQEYNKYFNLEEYILDYFLLRESKYILNFLLFFIYNRDIYVIKELDEKIKDKIIIFRKFIITILQKIEKYNNNKFSLLSQIISNIKTINNTPIKKDSNENLYINKIIKNKKLKFILGKESKIDNLYNLEIEYSNYLPILKNIALINISKCLPNTFCFGYKINLYLHDFIQKRKLTKKIDNINFITNPKYEKKISFKEPSKREFSTRKNTNYNKRFYNKSFYNENFVQGKSAGISFATIEDLNDKINDDKYYEYYPLNINTNRNIFRRAINDPEIKDIQLFINNFQNNTNKNDKRQKSIKFTIKNKNKKDALLNKMMNKNNNISAPSYNSFKNQCNKSILKNVNNNFTKLQKDSKYIKSINRKKTFSNNNNSLSGEMKKMNSNNNIILPNKGNIINSLNNVKPLKIIRQYSFKNTINRNFKKNVINRNINKKDSILLIPSFNSTTIRHIKKINKNKIMGNKRSISSLSSRRFSIRRSNSNKNINDNNKYNIKNEKNKKYIFKKNDEFYVELLRQSNKYDIKNILLENIESINRDSINNISIGHKNHFKERIFKYCPHKFCESNDNILRDGEYKDFIYKSNYYYNLLMKKIQKQNKINKDKYNNLIGKDINILHVSKSAEIYL